MAVYIMMTVPTALLKNVNHSLTWPFLPMQELNGLTPHSNFRLWLTTESHPKFPLVLLQSSLKITFEVNDNVCYVCLVEQS